MPSSIRSIRLAALIGLILSAYAVYVEHKVERQQQEKELYESRKLELQEEQAKAQALADSEGTDVAIPSLDELLNDQLLSEPEEFHSLCDIEAIGASCRCVTMDSMRNQRPDHRWSCR